jgi:REP element-mobilizing transposase RayT
MGRRKKGCAVQLGLDLARPRSGRRGGARPGAGRPRGNRVSHGRRERFSRHHPVHVTLRVGEGLGSLRRFRSLRVLRRALLACGQEGPFRVVHFNLLSNHLHLVVEAESAGALGKGMQRLAVRLAWGWNRLCGRKGRVFSDRYHARVIRTPRQARNTLVYVLCNARHHLSITSEGGRRAGGEARPGLGGSVVERGLVRRLAAAAGWARAAGAGARGGGAGDPGAHELASAGGLAVARCDRPGRGSRRAVRERQGGGACGQGRCLAGRWAEALFRARVTGAGQRSRRAAAPARAARPGLPPASRRGIARRPGCIARLHRPAGRCTGAGVLARGRPLAPPRGMTGSETAAAQCYSPRSAVRTMSATRVLWP